MKEIEDLLTEESFFPVMLSPYMIRIIIDHCQMESEQLKAIIRAGVFPSNISGTVLVQNFHRLCELEIICLKALAEFDNVDLDHNAEMQRDVRERIANLFLGDL
jgi:hypothetical protein